MSTNADIVYKIAEYIKPNPVIYTQLAMVNRDFYTVFTSDILWAKLDAYELKTNIYKDFNERKRKNKQIMKACWHPIHFEEFPTWFVDNRYVKLGYYADKGKIPAKLCENYKDTESKDNWLLKLLPNISSGYIYRFPEHMQSNRDFVLEICRQNPSEARYLPDNFEKNPAFLCEVLDITLTQGLGEWRLNCFTPSEVFKHAILYNPKALGFDEDSIDSVYYIAPEVIKDRAAVLKFVRGVPLYLDMFPEYWKDREICLAALEPNPELYYQDFFITGSFLYTCEDPVVIQAAIESSPDLVASINPKFRTKEAIDYAFKNAKLRNLSCIYERFLNEGMKFTDPEILGRCMDGGAFVFDAFGPRPPEELEDLCDNYDWMKERVENRPFSWHDASRRLAQDRDLLLIALKYSKVYGKNSRSALPIHYATVHIPEHLQNDQDVVRQVFEVCGLDSIPRHLQTKEIIIEHLSKGKDFLEHNYSYEILRELVKDDWTRIGQCYKAAERLASDPEMQDFIDEHIHEIYWECGAFHDNDFFPEFIYKRTGGNGPNGEDVPDWNYLPNESAQRIFARYPTKFAEYLEPWMSTAFFLEPLQRDGRLFGYLPKYYQEERWVHKRIGPFPERHDRYYNDGPGETAQGGPYTNFPVIQADYYLNEVDDYVDSPDDMFEDY